MNRRELRKQRYKFKPKEGDVIVLDCDAGCGGSERCNPGAHGWRWRISRVVSKTRMRLRTRGPDGDPYDYECPLRAARHEDYKVKEPGTWD